MPEPMSTPADAELVRYLSGDVSPGEARAIHRWLATSPEHRARLEDLRLVLDATEPVRVAWDAGASWERLAAQLEPVRRPTVVRMTSPWLRRGLIAAGLAAMAVGGWYVQASVLRSGSPSAAPGFTERRTARGERVSFRLADGSGVMLGPASRLRYRADYGACSPKTSGCARIVELEGDGYFEVVHDEARPFLVRTATATVRDLGTRFAIRARVEGRPLEVVVAEGSVAVGRTRRGETTGARHPLPPDSVVLAPGDVAHLADTGAAAVRRGVNVARYLGWTDGRLEFEQAPLPEVVEELARWYAVEIHLADSRLVRRVLTATFRDKPITDVLDLIAASLDLRVSHDRSAHPQRFVLDSR